MNCNFCEDVSDGAEYDGPTYYECTKRPHLSNLISFPFKNEQPCFEIDWVHLVDWDEEYRKMQYESDLQALSGCADMQVNSKDLLNKS